MPIPKPNEKVLHGLYSALRPWQLATRPHLSGLENIPAERPLLFVGNHSIWGLFDTCVLMLELHQRLGINLRALGDHSHFAIPGWGTFLTDIGVVDGNRETARELLQQGESVLVFPGGGREVAKRRGEKYQLMWKERLGFARMAVQNNARVVPFSAVGGEEMLDIVVDGDDVMRSALAPLIAALPFRHDIIIPLAKGLGPTPLPRPERLYFHFSPPILPESLTGTEDERATALRDRARDAVEAGMSRLFALRENDPMRSLPVRIADVGLEAVAQGINAAAQRVRAKRGAAKK